VRIMGSPHGYGYLPMEPITIAAVVGAAATVAGAGASIYSSNKASETAKDASDDQANEALRQRNELMEKQRSEEASTAAREAKNRQRLAGSKLGRNSTILTSPLGLPETGAYGGGTMLHRNIGGGAAA
jgi:hypothetical protein